MRVLGPGKIKLQHSMNSLTRIRSGVIQVLPPDMIVLAPPVPAEMVVAVGRAIELLPQVDPFSMHDRVHLSSFVDSGTHIENNRIWISLPED